MWSYRPRDEEGGIPVVKELSVRRRVFRDEWGFANPRKMEGRRFLAEEIEP